MASEPYGQSPLKGLVGHLASSYIAGESVEDALETTARLNALGLLVTIDNLGENSTTKQAAWSGVRQYLRLMRMIKERGLEATISLKLTHMGLDIDKYIALRNTRRIVQRAGALKNFVRLDMEGSNYTELTVEICSILRKENKNIGLAIQSYLRRSRKDVDRLIKEGVSVRLVKGAYKEPTNLAYPDKADVDKNYLLLAKRLLKKGDQPALATHDDVIITKLKAYATRNKIAKTEFEFQMLYGIKPALQQQLAQEGYRVRVYVPYGQGWIPYIIRRLSERKENLWFVLKNLIER